MNILENFRNHSLFAGDLPSIQSINMLGNRPKNGQIYFIVSEQDYYICVNDELKPLSELIGTSGVDMSLYDINKQIVMQQQAVSEEDIVKILYEFSEKNEDVKYFMLLCKDISYYTVFHKAVTYEPDEPDLYNGVISCLEYVGKIHDIEYDKEENGVAIWIIPHDSNEVMVSYLFPYDTGVCTIGG